MDEEFDTNVESSDVDISSDIESSDVIDDIPEDIPEDVPEDEPEDLADDVPEDIPEDVSEDEPEDLADDVPEDIPEDISEDDPEGLTDEVLEDVPENTPDDLSDITLEDESSETDEQLEDTQDEVTDDTAVSEESEDTTDDIEDTEADEQLEDTQDEVTDDAAASEESEDTADDIEDTEADEQVEDAQDEATDDPTVSEETEDTSADVEDAKADEQLEDTQDEVTDDTAASEESEDTTDDIEDTEADEQLEDTQDEVTDDTATPEETEDTSADVEDIEAVEQIEDTQDEVMGDTAASEETEDTSTNVGNTETEDQAEKELKDIPKNSFDNLSEYMNEHNYGIGDYSEYSQDPEWQRLHREAFPEKYAGQSEITSDIEDADFVEGQNFDPLQDTKNAFEFAEQRYDRSSAHWQEAANRQLDNLNQEMDDLNKRVPTAKELMDSKSREISDYVTSKGLTQETSSTDSHYQDLIKDYVTTQNQYNELSSQQKNCSSQINDISSSIIPEMKTTYRGMKGVSFNDSYNDYITEPQGRAVPGFGGVCGIDETCSIVNQQTGSNLGEADGIREYTDKGLCEMNGSYASNGGTNAIGRSEFLDSKGLSFQRVEGAYDNGNSISLDDVAKRFNNGESAGLMLKAQDLSQPDISNRRFDLSKSMQENKGRYYANHATTIAGFSYDNAGKTTGVWLNDTGGWAGSNRVFIDAKKFNQMQNNTKGFAIEFSRKR